jgi:large subunit ribosomal protein L15
VKADSLRPPRGASKRRQIRGRGIGSGRGVTSGRGAKGQKSRTNIRPGFEGGQQPLHRRLPRMRGFKRHWRKEYAVVNVGDLERFDAGTQVTPDLLLESGLVKRDLDGLKVLGSGSLTKKLKVKAHKFSQSAKAAIESAGGTWEAIGDA